MIDRVTQILAEQEELYFDCTVNYQDQTNKHYCIGYGSGLVSCGRVKSLPHRKVWKGINNFDKGEVKFDVYEDGEVIVNKEIKGELTFVLEIWEEDNKGFVELGFEWWDEEWDRALAILIYNGKFECGDNNELLFKLWFEEAAIADFTDPDIEGGVKIEYPNSAYNWGSEDDFIGTWISGGGVPGLGVGTPTKGSGETFTGEELKDAIYKMMQKE